MPVNTPVRGYPLATLPLVNTDLFYVVQGTASGSGDRKVQYKDLTNDSGVTPGNYGSATQVGAFTVNSKGFITAASNVTITGGGGGGGSNLDFFPQAEIGALQTPTIQAGNFTVGFTFICTRSLTVTGVTFYWAGGVGTKSVKVSLWDMGLNGSGTTLLATGTISVNSPNFYTVTFGSPQVLTQGHQFAVGTYETTGTNYTKYAPPSPYAPNDTTFAGLYIFGHVKSFIAGDHIPTSNDGNYHPIQLVATVT